MARHEPARSHAVSCHGHSTDSLQSIPLIRSKETGFCRWCRLSATIRRFPRRSATKAVQVLERLIADSRGQRRQSRKGRTPAEPRRLVVRIRRMNGNGLRRIGATRPRHVREAVSCHAHSTDPLQLIPLIQSKETGFRSWCRLSATIRRFPRRSESNAVEVR